MRIAWELEKFARLGTDEALNKLQQAILAHQARLAEAQQSKTGRSALVGAQRKRIGIIQGLIAECEQRIDKELGSLGVQMGESQQKSENGQGS